MVKRKFEDFSSGEKGGDCESTSYGRVTRGWPAWKKTGEIIRGKYMYKSCWSVEWRIIMERSEDNLK